MWWFLSARRGNSKISSLDLKKGQHFKKEDSSDQLKMTAKDKKMPSDPPPKKSSEAFSAKPAKELNVLFMYNGHDWDAYEVLGLPAGCSLKMVTQRYQELVRDADEGKLLFLQAAYESILKKQ